ncbi:MAG: hypothetical protein WCE94_15610 [Candidatus Methanoperedens sp.]
MHTTSWVIGTIPQRIIFSVWIESSACNVNSGLIFPRWEFKEKGVIFDLEPLQLEGGMKLASFKDPNGVMIELVEHPR